MTSIGEILSSASLQQKFPSEPTASVFSFPSPSTETVQQVKNVLHAMKDQLDHLLRILEQNNSGDILDRQTIPTAPAIIGSGGEQIIEGVFDGYQMVGPDGTTYAVVPNYASKSKLVEGDLLKLTITKNGLFIYKQIAPVQRKRVTGELMQDPLTHQWSVVVAGRPYKIHTASVTFYKGNSGDQMAILVPEDEQSAWGAVENILK